MPIYHYRVISGHNIYWYVTGCINIPYFRYEKPQVNEDDIVCNEGIPSIILEDYFTNQNPQQNKIYTINLDDNHRVKFIIEQIEMTYYNHLYFHYIM
jgi:hypothetical protein